jgi:hypothetical protein
MIRMLRMFSTPNTRFFFVFAPGEWLVSTCPLCACALSVRARVARHELRSTATRKSGVYQRIANVGIRSLFLANMLCSITIDHHLRGRGT